MWGGTLGLSIRVSTSICEELKGVGGDRSRGVATLGGDLKATLGSGAASRRAPGLMVDATLNIYGVGLSAGAGR